MWDDNEFNEGGKVLFYFFLTIMLLNSIAIVHFVIYMVTNPLLVISFMSCLSFFIRFYWWLIVANVIFLILGFHNNK